MIKINHLSDFTLSFRMADGSAIPREQFYIDFFTRGGLRYTVSSDDNSRFKLASDGKNALIVFQFDDKHPHLPSGQLLCNLRSDLENNTFPRGVQHVESPRALDVELWEGASEDSKDYAILWPSSNQMPTEKVLYTLPFTHEQVLKWAEVASEKVGQIMGADQVSEIGEAIKANMVVMIHTVDDYNIDGYYPCSAKVEDMVYINYLDNDGNVVAISFDISGTFDGAEVKPIGLPAGGEAGQVLTKTGEGIDDVEWVDVPQGGGGTVDIVDNLTTSDPTKALSANMGKVLNEKFQYKNFLAGKNLDQKGNILDAEGWNVTTPIAVVGGTALTFECGGTNTSALCEYDADGNFLDFWGQNAHPRTITTKANTAYVRLAVPNSPTQDYFVAQNDVILFNKLHEFDIVEQVAENTQKLENIGDSVEVKVENITDANGKPLNEILSEISVGGAEGALLYNTEQTLTDEQKSQVAKNIGQPREQLILEWTNEEAEVLQPTAYDAETGYFTVESMPSWLAEDGAGAYGIINYADNVLCPAGWTDAYGYIPMKSIPLPHGNEGTSFYVERVSESQIVLYTTNSKATRVTIPSGVRCDGFYLTNELWVALKIPTLTGNIKYRLTINRAALRPSMYRKVGVQGIVGTICGDHTDGGLGYQTKHHFETNSVYEFVVDFDNMKYIMTRIECNGQERTNTTGGTQAFVNPTLYGLYWKNIMHLPNSPTYVYINIDKTYINKYTTIKLYEIVE